MASCAVDKIAYRVEHQSDLRGITKIEVEVTPWRPFAEIEVSFAGMTTRTRPRRRPYESLAPKARGSSQMTE